MRESLWRSARSSYIRILPDAISVSPKCCSLPLQRAVCDFGFESSFRKAAGQIQEHYGFNLPLSAVAGTTRVHAGRIAAVQCKRTATASALPARSRAEQIVAEADGSFLRIVSNAGGKGDARKSREVNYQEARLCASAAKGSNRIYYDATFGAVETVAPLWASTAKQAGMSLQSHVHILADGATWIDSQGKIAFAGQGRLLIDLYHVLDYLHAAAQSCSKHPQRWLNTQKRRLKKGRSAQVITELKQHLEPQNYPDCDCPVRN